MSHEHLTEIETSFGLNRQMNGHLAQPHPDGKPWTKCCKSDHDGDCGCQCAMRKPAKDEARMESYYTSHEGIKQLRQARGRFFCVHRKTDDGYHRECAGWYAKIGRERHEKA